MNLGRWLPWRTGNPAGMGRAAGRAPVKAAKSLLALEDVSIRERVALDLRGLEQVHQLEEMVSADLFSGKSEPPSFPATAARVIDVVENPEPDTNKLLQVIGQDPAIAARVMACANAAIYARTQPVQTLRQALTTLGYREVARVAVGVASRALFEMEARAEQEVFADLFASTHHGAMTNAFACAGVAFALHLPEPDSLFLGGMLVDVGRPVVLRAVASLLVTGKVRSRPSDAVLGQLVGKLHTAVGADLCRAWGLPDPLPLLCARHHLAPAHGDPRALNAVRMVDALSALRVRGALTLGDVDRVTQSATALGLDLPKLRVARRQVEEAAARVSSMFGLKDPAAPAEPAPPAVVEEAAPAGDPEFDLVAP